MVWCMTNEELMEIAISSMLELNSNSPAFEIRELFHNDEWDKLSIPQRRAFGKYFAKVARNNDVEGIKFMPISKNGRHNMYKVY